MQKTTLLKRLEDDQGPRILRATLTENGEVRLEGHDLGSGVEEFFGPGFREYEYIMSIKADDVPALQNALGVEGDILIALQTYFDRQVDIAPKGFLDAHHVPYTFWSRLGD